MAQLGPAARLAIAAALLALVVVPLGSVADARARAHRTLSWPACAGVLLAASDDEGGPRARYRHEIGGRVYQGGRV